MEKLKMPSIKRFDGTMSKLRGFLTQMRLNLHFEGHKVATPADAVGYAGLYLTGRALEWFEPYMTEYQENGMTTTNREVKYMFSSWDACFI